ncbi:hypothetical protein K461DRAFT_156213 [Myriangium duriaei CBS 260.36]|uniref:Uncharacterized protein n=1 Tax=Myriangium duriaei CBS 260.36 TaxID=1168546 RepID=A0A9P4MEY1_9PEZI|nr:hypothetical protein K461DRAFT_156213 [Myriangium duriaei CBS 260.36]
MPPGGRRIQTSKQAKAAFKARGSTFVSATERKQLARGAELLRRAERIKDQEEKKKQWQKRKNEEQIKGQEDTKPLGSQRIHDKFGYQSSQFHLGKFFSAACAAKRSNNNETNDETVDEAEDAAPLRADTPPSSTVDQPADQTIEPQTSPVDLSVFLDSSTQLTRDLNSSPTDTILPTQFSTAIEQPISPLQRKSPQKVLSVSFPSFSSEDGLFDDTTLMELDRAAEQEIELRRSQSPTKQLATSPMPLQSVKAQEKVVMPPPSIPAAHSGVPPQRMETRQKDVKPVWQLDSGTSRLPSIPGALKSAIAKDTRAQKERGTRTMLPPARIVQQSGVVAQGSRDLHRSRNQVKRSKLATGKYPTADMGHGAGSSVAADLNAYGISAADLEWVAGCEVQLSQFS